MSTVLPFEIIALIIDIVGENNDTDLLRKLSLVSHSFHSICSKHLFATVELSDIDQHYRVARSKKGFIKLVKSRPDVVKYIRKLKYNIQILSYPSTTFNDDRLLSSILPNLFRTISHLNCLTIAASQIDWNLMDSSLTSALLYLMHLPTINHIDLSYIQGFPVSSLTPCINLHRLGISNLGPFYGPEEEVFSEIVIQSEMIPEIREFHTSASPLLTTKLLHAKNQDGQPAFDFTDLRRLSTCLEDEKNLQYFLQNAKSLEKLHLSVRRGQSVVMLYDILSPSARTLKALDFTVSIYNSFPQSLAGLCEGLETIAGRNMLESLSFEVLVDDHEAEDTVGSYLQSVEKVLVKPGWSALKQVSFKVTISSWGGSAEPYKALVQSLPDKYLSQISTLESVAFNFSVAIEKIIILMSPG